MLVIHQNASGLKPGVPILGRTEAQLGDAIELILVNAVVADAGGLRPETALVMRYVELPILKLPWEPRAHWTMHVPPIVVEELKRDSSPLPKKHVENDASRCIPRRNIVGSHKLTLGDETSAEMG
jgi:hypothetical protein